MEVTMFNKACLGILGALAISPQQASADAPPTSRCVDVAIPRNVVTSHNGTWIELTLEQWQFLRGIYAMNPETPAGLPYGNKAALAQFSGFAGGLVFFIDGNQACTPMRAPPELLFLIHEVATGDVNHQGTGL